MRRRWENGSVGERSSGGGVLFVSLAVALAAAGCDGGGPEQDPEPVPRRVDHIRVVPDSATIAVNETVALTVVAYDAHGRPVPGHGDRWRPTWRAANPPVADLAPGDADEGTVVGQATGQGAILVEVEGLAAHALVTVVASRPSDLRSWEARKPTGSNLRSLWAVGPDDVWAVGDGGEIVHFDGAGWRPVDAPEGATLTSVWASAGDDVWAVGVEGRILRYDGAQWSPVRIPVFTHLMTVFGTARDDVWAAGSDGTILHFDGDAWRWVTSAARRTLNAIWGVAGDDLWAAGDRGNLLRYDGVGWTETESPTPARIVSLWGSAVDDVWMVDGEGAVHRFDGESWDEHAVLDLMPRQISGTGPDDVWVVGGRWGIGPARAFHYDGSAWREVLPPSDELLLALAFTGDGERWAVGSGGEILFGDRDGWRDPAWPTSSPLRAVWGARYDEVWAVVGGANCRPGSVQRFDGRGWVEIDVPDSPPLVALWGSGPDDVWALAEPGRRCDERLPSALRYDGAAWRAHPGPPPWVRALWGSGPGDVWAVGGTAGFYGYGYPQAVVAHFDGTEWRHASSGVGTEYLGVWGSGPRDVWAVGVLGDGGTIVRFDGEAWWPVDIPGVPPLTAVWGTGPGDVWAVGWSGTALHYDGTAWRQVPVPTDGNLDAVWGFGPEDVFAAGTGGTVIHYDGTEWRRIPTTSDRTSLLGVWGSWPSETVFVVRRGGQILQSVP